MTRLALTCSLLLALVPVSGFASDTPLRLTVSATGSQFGFDSPAHALQSFRDRPDVFISNQGGWTIVDDRVNSTIWSFTPPNHPAHPAGVKRVLEQDAEGMLTIVMTAKCGASKIACDNLIAEFHELNEQIREGVRSQLKKQ